MLNLKNCKIVGDGIGYDVYGKQPDNVKRGDPKYVMSRGELMMFAKNPMKWLAGVEDEDTKSTEYGDLIDSLLLSPLKFESKFVIAPAEYAPGKPWNWNATVCKEWRDDKEAQGLTITTDKEMKKATTALDALKRNMDIMELVECSKTQVMVKGEYHDKLTGIIVPLKILIDIVPDKNHKRFGKCLADFKTATSAAMWEFGRAINQHHYDAQCGLYLPMYVQATKEDRVDWRLAVQESSEPYHSEMYILNGTFEDRSEGGSFVSNGMTKIKKSIELYCWCLKYNKWPGYSITARTKWDGLAIIESEAWMTSNLASFCPLPPPPEDWKPQDVLDFDREVTP